MKKPITYYLIVILAAVVGHIIAYKLVHIPRQLELVVILSLLLFYPILRKPIIGLYAVFIVSPFIPYIRRLYYLVYERPSLDPLIMIGDLFLAFILLGLFFEFQERRGQYEEIAVYSKIVSIYFIYLMIRTVFLNNLPLAEALARFKYYGPPVLFFFVAALYADKLSHLKNFWYITIVIGLSASLYGFNQLYNGYSKAEMIWFSSIEFSTLFIKGVARPFSIFQAPVALADYLQLAIIGILMSMIWTKKRLHIFLLAAIPLIFYAALITSVRSSWAGIIVSLLIWFVFFRIKGNHYRFLALGVLLLIYIGYQYFIEPVSGGFQIDSVLPATQSGSKSQEYFELLVSGRATALYDPLGEHSFLSRLQLWKNLINYAKDPILAFFGRGLGCLKADSLYFTYLAEFGYPGMIFIAGLFIIFIQLGLRIIDTSGDPEIVALAKGITILNIVFAIVSITGTHIHYFPGDIYFWFWNGILVQVSVFNKQDTSEKEESIEENHQGTIEA